MTVAQHPPSKSALNALLDQVAVLNHPGRQITPLTGGLTNCNYQVTVPTGRYVVRCSRPEGSLLSIDRAAEYENSRAAAAVGVAPRVVDYLPGQGVLVIDWIDGRTLTEADLGQHTILEQIAQSCRRLHAGPKFCNDFNMGQLQRRYLTTTEQQGFRIPVGFHDYLSRAAQIEAVFAARPMATVPCHNDLLPGNFILSSDQLWLIDYEYSGNNDPCFELGNIWSEACLADDCLDYLVTAYFADHRPDMLARARLHAIMAQYGWSLWAAIQANISHLDFDFWSWGMAKYERAIAAFKHPRFNELLHTALNRLDTNPLGYLRSPEPRESPRTHSEPM